MAALMTRVGTGLILGRLVSANERCYQFCCLAGAYEQAKLGALVQAVDGDRHVYALISGIEYAEGGLTRLIAATPDVSPAIVTDGGSQNGGPLLTARFVGWDNSRTLVQTLPPQPPHALTEIWLCSAEDVQKFTQRTSYLRLLYQGRNEFSLPDLLAAHLLETSRAYQTTGNGVWWRRFLQELIGVMAVDTATLQLVLGAIAESRHAFRQGELAG